MTYAYGYALPKQISTLHLRQNTSKVAVNVIQGAWALCFATYTTFLNYYYQLFINKILCCSKIACFVLVLSHSQTGFLNPPTSLRGFQGGAWRDSRCKSGIICDIDAISCLFIALIPQQNVRLLNNCMLHARAFALRNQLPTLGLSKGLLRLRLTWLEVQERHTMKHRRHSIHVYSTYFSTKC
jgi:hypothetical protein